MNDDFDPETSQKCNFAATYLSPGKEDQEKERKVEQEAEKEEESGVKEWAKDKESKKNERKNRNEKRSLKQVFNFDNLRMIKCAFCLREFDSKKTFSHAQMLV